MPFRLLLPAACWALGLWLADFVAPGALVAGTAGSVGVGLLVCAWAVRRSVEIRPFDRLPRMGFAAVMACAGIAGVGFADLGLRAAAAARAHLPALDGTIVVLKGKVAADPEPSGRAVGFPLKAGNLNGRPVSERAAVRIFGKGPPVQLGDRVEITGRARALDSLDPFDERARRGWIAGNVTASGDDVSVIASSSNPLIRWSNGLRSRMREVALDALDRSDAGLLLGLTIGDESLIDDVVREDFRQTGLSHLTAVSGANVAIVLGAVILLLRGFHLSRRTQIVAGLGVVCFFAVLTRWEPSVLRASVMAAVVLAAFFFGRQSNPVHGLFLAFIGLTAADPYLFWSPGFQLSVAATAGILFITPKLLHMLHRLPRFVAEALAVGLGAQLAVAPLVAFHFGRISFSAIPANLAAFPLVAPVTVLGMLGGALGTFAPAPARVLYEIAGLGVAPLRGIASLFAGMPFGSASAGGWGAVEVIVAYIVIGAAVARFTGRGGTSRFLLAGSAVAIILLLVWPAAGSSPPTGLRITFFDVGQGDAALVESSGGARILIDGGPDPHLLQRLLSDRGVERIDLVALSHGHADHVKGLERVTHEFDVRLVLDPGVPNARIRSLHLSSVEAASEGDGFVLSDVSVDVLGPSSTMRALALSDGGGEESEGSVLNDSSLVIRIRWKNACALFTGDIEEPAQMELVDSSNLVCSLLKAPHHGSAALESAFVEEVDPEVVVVSVGRNSFGHPTRTALRLFEGTGARVLRTDRLGDVVLEWAQDSTWHLRQEN